jgi:nitroreductase
VHALAGAPLAELLATVRAKMPTHPRGDGSEYEIYPAALWEPYRSRRFKCGEDLYATIGVARDDKFGRLLQFARNYEFFGAPVGMFFCLDRRMGPPQWSDVGMYMQSVMLLAREHGLHTCAQEAWSVWHRTVGEFLRLPPELLLFAGMALGYRDESAPINRLRTDRAPLGEFAELRGF